MMFQRAEPELNGFGVITSASSFSSRSLKDLIPRGLPFSTRITTTESVAIAAVRLFFPAFGDEFAFFDEPFHVAAGGEVDDRGGLARGDRTTLVAGGAEASR